MGQQIFHGDLGGHDQSEYQQDPLRGNVDVAFLRREAQAPGLAFKFLVKEPLVAVLPTGHRLAAHAKIRPQDLAGETYVSPTRVAPVLKSVIESYAAKVGIA